MTDVKKWYLAATSEAKVELLLKLSHRLTVYARYPEWDSDRLRGINEIQHKIVGQALALLLGRTNRYPDEFVAELLDTVCSEHAIDVDRLLPSARGVGQAAAL